MLLILIRQQGGIKLDDPDGNSSEGENETNKELEEEEILIKQKEIAAKKAKQDELWATFKKDTGIIAQKSSKATPSQMVRLKCLTTLSLYYYVHHFTTYNKLLGSRGA